MRVKNKLMIKVVAIVLIACAGVVLLGNITGGFQNMKPSEWQLREVNKDNLYQDLTFADTDGTLEDGADGIAVTLEKNNVLKVNGTAEADKEIMVGTTTLKAGSYVFDSSLKNGTKGTIYLRVVNTANDEVLASDYSAASVFTVSADTSVRLEIVVAKNAAIKNLTLEVVLCEGTAASELVSFYK